VLLRFLRCFALYREMEADLVEARAEVAIARERADFAARQLEIEQNRFDLSYAGQVEALKINANVAGQMHNPAAKPLYPEAWHLTPQPRRELDLSAIPTGRAKPSDAVVDGIQQFHQDLDEYLSKQTN
jgi:hypothetical protein